MRDKSYTNTRATICFVLCFVVSFFDGVRVEAQDLQFKPDLKAAGWKIHTPRGKAAAQFEVLEDGSLKITAPQAVAFLYRFISKDQGAASSLSWDWRISQSFPATDLSRPGQDDRPLAVHVYFTDQDAGVLSRLGTGLAGFFGVPVSGRAITYVWGGLQPEQTILPNPFMDEGDGVLVIRKSGLQRITDEWVTETVDLAADYEQAFGEAMPPVSVIAVSADTDDTGATSQALVRDVRLMSAPILAR